MLQGAQNWNLCIPQNSVQPETTRTIAVVQCNYIKTHGLILTIPWKTTPPFLTANFPPAGLQILHRWELVSLRVPMPGEKAAAFRGAGICYFWRGKTGVFPHEMHQAKGRCISGPCEHTVPIPWCSEVHSTSTLTSEASSLLWKELPSQPSLLLTTAQHPQSTCVAPLLPCCIPASIPTLPFGTKSPKIHLSLSLSMLRNILSFPCPKAAEVWRLEPKWSWCYNKALRKAAGCIVTSLWAKSLP